MHVAITGLARAIAIFLFLTSQVSAQTFNWTDADKQSVETAIANGDYGSITSLWIERNGDLVYEAYFNGADADTFHNMRSVGKTFTGMLVGAAIEDGFIDGVDEKAAKYFRDLKPFANPDKRKNDLTLKDLLTMSGPLECNDWNSFSRGNEERMYLVENWSKFFWDLPIRNRPSWEIPEDDGGFGRAYSYCTAGAQLLGEIVERTTGKSAPDYAGERLFKQIGIVTPKWNYAATGKAHLGGGLELTTADWAKIGRLAVNKGRANGAQLLPESWIDESLTDYVQIEPGVNYGYLWWRPQYTIGENKYSANMMTGTGANRVYVLPEFGIVVVITKNDYRNRQAHSQINTFFTKEIVRRLSEE